MNLDTLWNPVWSVQNFFRADDWTGDDWNHVDVGLAGFLVPAAETTALAMLVGVAWCVRDALRHRSVIDTFDLGMCAVIALFCGGFWFFAMPILAAVVAVTVAVTVLTAVGHSVAHLALGIAHIVREK